MAPDITLFPIQQTMPSPLISVIVPIYNMESLLPRCLDSRAAQALGGTLAGGGHHFQTRLRDAQGTEGLS